MSETVVNAEAGRVACGHRRVAVVGAGPSRDAAPYADPAWCVWALNEIPQARYDRHFELHPMRVQNARELAWLRACPAPCYVLDLADARAAGVRVPVRYPLEHVLAAGGRDYFACTFAYQAALALADGAEAVGLWGCELYLGTPRERTAERACLEYWLGVAEGRGVRVVADSGLARRPYRYGYHYETEKTYVEDSIAQLRWGIEHEEQRRRGGA